MTGLFPDQATYAQGGGTANAQTVPVPNVVDLANLLGVPVNYIPSATNTTDATIALAGLAATQVRKATRTAGLQPLTGNELQSGVPTTVMYNGTYVVLMAPTPPPPAPTQQTITTPGSGTYTTGVVNGQRARQIRIREIAGGGGGAGVSTGGSTGGTTSFNSISVIGGGGAATGSSTGGIGGTGGTGTAVRFPGSAGQNGQNGADFAVPGSNGAPGIFGMGAGRGTTGAGGSGGANTGAGGSGQGGANTTGGGGSGEYAEFIINNPDATYSYTLGSGGSPGTGGATPGTGGSGIIIIDEFY